MFSLFLGENKRFLQKKQFYLFNTTCEIIYMLIFLVGLMNLLENSIEINYFYFFLFFSSTNMILSSISELEYEIRSDQFVQLTNNNHSFFQIYSIRGIINFFWLTLIYISGFLIFAYIISPVNIGVLTQFDLLYYGLITLFNIGLFSFLYFAAVKLTLKYHRVSVFLNFIYSLILAFSGLVFPIESFFTYKDLLEYCVEWILPYI